MDHETLVRLTILGGALGMVLIANEVFYFFRASRGEDHKKLTKSYIGSVVIATIASIIAFVGSQLQSPSSPTVFARRDVLASDLVQLQTRIKELELHERKFEESSLLQPPVKSGGNAAMAKQLRGLEDQIHETQAAQKKFEGILISDAEKVITLPLLKTDVAAVHSEVENLRLQLVSQTQLLQETQNQTRWVIGTLALGLLALVVPTIRDAFRS